MASVRVFSGRLRLAIDPLFEDRRRLEHHHPARRNQHFCPSFGLRPMRSPFLRTTNEPNDESFTVSPRSRQSVISLRTSSTRKRIQSRDRPTFWVNHFAQVSPCYRLTGHRSSPTVDRRSYCIFNDIESGPRCQPGPNRNLQGLLPADQGRAPENPPPMASRRTRSPRLIRRSATASHSAERDRGSRRIAVLVNGRHNLRRDRCRACERSRR